MSNIDGGAGSNTLDYSALSSAISISLTGPGGSAGYNGNNTTGISNTFSNISIITGDGNANSTVTGDSNGGIPGP